MAVTTYSYSRPGMLAHEDRAGEKKFYRFNDQGSTTQMFDVNTNITDTFEFDYFGNEVSRTGSTPTPFRWNALLTFNMTGTNSTFALFGQLLWDSKLGRFTVSGKELAEFLAWLNLLTQKSEEMWKLANALFSGASPWDLFFRKLVVRRGSSIRTRVPRKNPPTPRVFPPSSGGKKSPEKPEQDKKPSWSNYCPKELPCGSESIDRSAIPSRFFTYLFCQARCTFSVFCWQYDIFESFIDIIIGDPIIGGCTIATQAGKEHPKLGGPSVVGGSILDVLCFVECVRELNEPLPLPSWYGCNLVRVVTCEECCISNCPGPPDSWRHILCVKECEDECC